MKKTYLLGMASVLIIAFHLIFSISGSSQEKPQADVPEWEVSGHYGEACSCDVGCPCIFKVPATHGYCNIALLFDVVKGKYGIIDLSDLKVVVTGDIGKGTFLSYYIDDRATVEQKEALVNIFKGLMKGIKVKEDLGVKSVPIKSQILPKSLTVHIPGVLEFKVDQVMGMDGSIPTTIANPPMHFLLNMIVSKSAVYKYKDHGKEWEYSGRSGFQGDFFFSSLMFK